MKHGYRANRHGQETRVCWHGLATGRIAVTCRCLGARGTATMAALQGQKAGFGALIRQSRS